MAVAFCKECNSNVPLPHMKHVLSAPDPMPIDFWCGKTSCGNWIYKAREDNLGRCKLIEKGLPVEILSIGNKAENECECRQFKNKWR